VRSSILLLLVLAACDRADDPVDALPDAATPDGRKPDARVGCRIDATSGFRPTVTNAY
jgi:hypothetical protein